MKGEEPLTAEFLKSPGIEDFYPMSDIEKGMVFYSIKDSRTSAYHSQAVFQLKLPDFDSRRFRNALELMIDKHPILRTGFNMYDFKEPIQIVHTRIEPDIQVVDLTPLAAGEQEEYLRKLLADDMKQPFNINNGQPLWRMRIAVLSPEDLFFAWISHHAIIDGWSSTSLMTELNNTYYTLKSDPGFVPRKLKSSYKDFVIEQIMEKKKEENASFWKNELDDYKRLDFPAGIHNRHEPRKIEIFEKDLGEAALQSLQRVARTFDTSIKHLCFAAYIYILAMLSLEDDIVAGLLTNNRPQCEDGDKILGCFLNSIPVRVTIPLRLTWSEYIRMIENKMLELKRYDRLALFEIVRITGEGSSSRNPFFDTLFNFVDFHIYHQAKSPGNEKKSRDDGFGIDGSATTNTLFNFRVDTTLNTLYLSLAYSNHHLDRKTVQRYCGYFESIIETMSQRPGTIVDKEDLLSSMEKEQLLTQLCGNEEMEPHFPTLDQWFENQAAKSPDNTAMVGPGFDGKLYHISYRTLMERTHSLASTLITAGVQPGTVVAVILERSLETLTAILAIFKAGGTYLPIEPGYPEERVMTIFNETKPMALITQQSLRVQQENPGSLYHLKRIVFIDRHHVFQENNHQNYFSSRISVNRPDSAAYIIYTSGTTGKPNGIIAKHRHVCHFITGYDRETLEPHGGNLKLNAIAPLVFDGFIKQLFGALLFGRCLHIVPENLRMDGKGLLSFYLKYGIDISDGTPAHIYLLTENSREHCLKLNLKRLIIAGEVLPIKILKRFFNRFALAPPIVTNAYGPTECCIVSTLFHVTREDISRYRTIPVGRPMPNEKIYIVNRRNKLQPIGAAGEICISGAGTAEGYINRDTITRERFIRNSLTGEPMYRTGDLGRWVSGNHLAFLGRLDKQVKIRGFRLEPEGIRLHLLEHPQVNTAVVMPRTMGTSSGSEYKSSDLYLCAYFVPSNMAKSIDPGQLRTFLSNRLPAYMVPAFFIPLDKIPLTERGKTDFSALPGPLPESTTDAGTYTPPANETEEKITQIWVDILNIKTDRIGTGTNFFEIGGHSLKATLLVARMQKELNVSIAIQDVFTSPTIAQLSELVQSSQRKIATPLAPVEEKEHYPVSASQKRLYILQKMVPNSTLYNIPRVFPLTPPIDFGKIEQTFKELIKRQESLRTSFCVIDDEPRQKIHPPHEAPFAVTSFKLLSSPDHSPDQELERITTTFVQPFDLCKAPLMRVGVIHVAHRETLLILDIHHIICDGASQELLQREFMMLYTGKTPPLPEARYRDYVLWQHSTPYKERVREQENYWLREFSGEIPVLSLPTDHPRPQVRQFDGSRLRFEISTAETQVFKKQTENNNITLFMVFLALYNVLLAKISGQEEIVVGTMVAGRRHARLEDIVGMFVNTLAIRNEPLPDKPFKQFLSQVKEKTLNAFDNQDFQFEDLVERVDINRDTSRNPIFDAVLVFQNFSEPRAAAPEIDGSSFSFYDKIVQTAKFDLTLRVSPSREKTSCILEYSSTLFERATIDRFVQYFRTIASQLATHPDLKIGELDILSQDEKERLLYQFNEPRAGYLEHQTIHRLFEQQVESFSQKIALVDPGRETITYARLNERANQLARLLRNKQVTNNSIVALLIPPSIDMIAAILAVLKAGGGYLPIAPGLPGNRIHSMLEDSRARIVISRSDIFGRHSNQAAQYQHEVLLLDALNGSHTLRKTGNPENINQPSDLAYIIFTSGSTGKPKGVMIEHRNVVQLLFSDRPLFDFDHNDVWTLFHSYSFDFSVWEMFGALLYGGTLVLIPQMIAKDTRQYLEILKKENVTVLNQTPAAFYNLAELEVREPRNDLNLRYVIFGGEALKPFKLHRWQEKYPRTQLINMFGITETTVHVTHKQIEETDIRLNISNIGRQLPTLTRYIMDKNLNLAPTGVAGEICVGGQGVARGYLNRPQLTSEKFVPNPLVPGERLYRSGDLGRLLANTDMEYLGRIDHQVKIRGYRIELGEIENPLLEHRQIKEAVVLALGDPGETYLCAYLVPEPEAKIAAADLRELLSRKLPNYMVPSYFVRLDHIPLTPNGKVDRRALPAPKPDKDENEYLAPGTDMEKTLAGLWAELLFGNPEEYRSISIDDDFFQLGGHSLLATVLVTRIRTAFNVDIPLVEFFQTPTIQALAQYIGNNGSQPNIYPPGDDRLVILKKSSPEAANLFLVHEVSGEVDAYLEFCKRLPSGLNCWGLRSCRLSSLAPQHFSVQELAAGCIKIIKKIQPAPPYHIAGWSIGGTIAFEMQRQLEQTDGETGLLAIIDSPSPDERMRENSVKFTLESELSIIQRFLPADFIREIPENIPGIGDLWNRVEEFLKKTGCDPRLVKALIPGQLLQVIPLENRSEIQDWIYYLNLVRSLTNARDRYIPPGKLKTQMYFFGAAESGVTSKNSWNRYCSRPIKIFEIPGDHYSIMLEQAALRKLTDTFNQPLSRSLR